MGFPLFFYQRVKNYLKHMSEPTVFLSFIEFYKYYIDFMSMFLFY